jgi:hypothetical protein
VFNSVTGKLQVGSRLLKNGFLGLKVAIFIFKNLVATKDLIVYLLP